MMSISKDFSPSDYQVVFFGTPDFSVPCLRALHTAGYTVSLVVTRPDAQAGRGKKMQEPPMKKAAAELGIPVVQPEKMKDRDFFSRLQEAQADIFVVVGFGKIIPVEILALPVKGCINVHPSLLPELRGPTPVQTALLRGLKRTGVTIMVLDEGMDSGPVLVQKAYSIKPSDDAGTLYHTLFGVGAKLLIDMLPRYLSGTLSPVSQDHSKATVSKILMKEDGQIDWSRDSKKIELLIRAFTPWPGSFTFWMKDAKGNVFSKRIKILRAKAVSGKKWRTEGIGRVTTDKRSRLLIQCGRGSLIIDSLQLEGKKVQTAQEFLQGAKGFVGSEIS